MDRARAAARMCDSVGEHGYAVYNRHVLGFLELSRGNAAIALDLLSADPKTSGIEGTKRISFVGDEIEALIQLGRHAEAGALGSSWRSVAPCWPGHARRGRRPLSGAPPGCGRGGGSPRDRARTRDQAVLRSGPPLRARPDVHGSRRGSPARQQKRATREAFEEAAAGFDALGAQLWAARARRAWIGSADGPRATASRRPSGASRSSLPTGCRTRRWRRRSLSVCGRWRPT